MLRNRKGKALESSLSKLMSSFLDNFLLRGRSRLSAAGEARDFWRTKPSRGLVLLSTEEMDFCLTSCWVLASGIFHTSGSQILIADVGRWC